MIAARPPEGDRIAVRRTESLMISAARPPEGDRIAVRRTEIPR
jgi:hypothetical protein